MNKFTVLITIGLITLWSGSVIAETLSHRDSDKINKNSHLKNNQELIKTDYKKEDNTAIRDRQKKIRDESRLHREKAKDAQKNKRDVYEGRKNIRDRDHN